MKIPTIPTVHIYARVSHRNSVEEGDSVPDQIARCTEYVKFQLKLPHVKAWKDEGRSAYKTAFSHRPSVCKMFAEMRPGDHLVIDKLDRIARNVLQILELIEQFDRRQITLHIRNFAGGAVDLSSPMGRAFIQFAAVIAELESGIKSERIRDAMNEKRKRGESLGTKKNCPLGMQIRCINVEGKMRSYLEWSPRRRGTMQDIHRLRDEIGLGWMAIAEILNQEYCARTGIGYEELRPFHQDELQEAKSLAEKKGLKRLPGKYAPFNVTKVRNYYTRERLYKEFEQRGITSPRDVAIELYAWRVEKKKEKGYCTRIYSMDDLSPETAKQPALDWRSKLPKWASENPKIVERIEKQKTQPRHTRRVFEAIGTLDRFLELQEEQLRHKESASDIA